VCLPAASNATGVVARGVSAGLTFGGGGWGYVGGVFVKAVTCVVAGMVSARRKRRCSGVDVVSVSEPLVEATDGGLAREDFCTVVAACPEFSTGAPAAVEIGDVVVFVVVVVEVSFANAGSPSTWLYSDPDPDSDPVATPLSGASSAGVPSLAEAGIFHFFVLE
jgi:hypothetical protein